VEILLFYSENIIISGDFLEILLLLFPAFVVVIMVGVAVANEFAIFPPLLLLPDLIYVGLVWRFAISSNYMFRCFTALKLFEFPLTL